MTRPAAHPTRQSGQPWIHSAALDSVFILLPPILISLIVVLFPRLFRETTELPPWAWMLLVVGIDVAHVYSSLYRTYFDREEFSRRSVLYTFTPLLCWTAGAILYALGPLIFWRALAYLAVFHFVRQQYGFMMIYARRERHHPRWARLLDGMTIYATMLYPLFYWHTHLPRNFNWFIEADFISLPKQISTEFISGLYGLLLLLYLLKEIALYARDRRVSIPKNLVVLGTAATWHVGIVLLNGDLACTATNVVAHGIPYTALIWIYCHRKWSNPGRQESAPPRLAPRFYSVAWVPLFLSLLFLFAYVEEGIWEILVWRDHPTLFGEWSAIWQISDPPTLSWLIPLLALPQTTHYVLDGFIWRMKRQDSDLKQILFGE